MMALSITRQRHQAYFRLGRALIQWARALREKTQVKVRPGAGLLRFDALAV